MAKDNTVAARVTRLRDPYDTAVSRHGEAAGTQGYGQQMCSSKSTVNAHGTGRDPVSMVKRGLVGMNQIKAKVKHPSGTYRHTGGRGPAWRGWLPFPLERIRRRKKTNLLDTWLDRDQSKRKR